MMTTEQQVETMKNLLITWKKRAIDASRALDDAAEHIDTIDPAVLRNDAGRARGEPTIDHTR
jgi:hypothetical protein